MTQAPKDNWIESNGLRLHYCDWGGHGQPVVLLHGLASTCHIWDLVAPILSEGFRVVALDQRGHGESDKPDGGYDFDSVSQDLRGFIQGLGLSLPLIGGHSWGGDVALEYAAAHPEAVKGLCLVDGGVIELSANPDMTLERAREELAPPDFGGTTVEQMRERIGGWPLGQSMTPQLMESVMANFEVLADNTVRARLSRENHMRLIDALWQHHPSTLYRRVSCPVLLMPARQHDNPSPMPRRFRREEAIRVATKLLPTSKTVWLEDSIHDVPLQRPQLVADVIIDRFNEGFF